MRRNPFPAVLLLAAGCGHGDTAAPSAVPSPETPMVDITTVAGATSNDGTYYIAWQTQPDPIPIGEPFTLQLWVLAGPAGGEPVPGVDVQVSAWMPDHYRWMEQDPEISRHGPGRFGAEGMLFQMAGRWELYVDVTRDGLTERGQFSLRIH